MKPAIFLPVSNGEPAVNACEGCDADCACALPVSARPGQALFTQIPQDWTPQGLRPATQFQTWPVTEDAWILTAPGAPQGWALVNQAARQVFEFFTTSQPLETWAGDSVFSTEEFHQAAYIFYQSGFLISHSQPFLTTHISPSPKPALEAWLFLTRACNLACAHCFVSKDPRQMTPTTGLQAVERLFELAEQHGHPGLKIKYAGGEPTLRWGLVKALHERACTLAQQHGLSLTAILATNGAALSRARLNYLKTENIHIAFSLDGFGAGHDRQRPFVNGQSSFARVFGALQLALEMDLRPYLTITLTRLNLGDLPALTEFALQNRLFLNWNFYRPHSPNDPLTASPDELTAALRAGLTVIEQQLPDYPFLDKLIDRSNFGMAHEHACGAGRNYLSIDYDGRALPCHMLSGGNQPGLPLKTLSRVEFEQFPNPSVDEKFSCQACEWRYWCAGGCPILAGTLNGSAASPSPYCQVYQALYPEVLRLKGLQLLALNNA